MAYFEKLGNRAFGVDDSWGPLRLAREHDPDMNLVRGNALATPFADNSFDAAFSSYVAEHFEEGPEVLFREIHRVLKPRRPVLRRRAVQQHLPPLRREPDPDGLCAKLWKWRGKGSASPSSATRSAEMDGFLRRTDFDIVEVRPDDYFPPWSEGPVLRPLRRRLLLQLRAQAAVRVRPVRPRRRPLPAGFGIWHSCGGIFYVARARK